MGPIDTKEWTPADTLRLFAAVAENRVARIRQVRARGGAERAAMARRRSARAAVRPAVAHRSRSPFCIWHFFSLVELRGVASLFPRTPQRTSPADAGARTRTDVLDFAPSGHPCPQPFDAPPEGRALDVNIKEEGGQGRTAVHVAAFHGAEVACQTCAAVAAS